VVTRSFDGPARLVFLAWSRPELLRRWWVPESFPVKLLSCEADVRTGGTYRLEFGVPGRDEPLAFFGRYIEVVPPTRIVWSNDEDGGGGPVTTVTFEERDGWTHIVLTDRYPSGAALEEAIASGSVSGYAEQFEALEALLGTLGE